MKEDETILNCSNLDGGNYWDIYSTQKKVVSRLLKLSSFTNRSDVIFKDKKLGVRGRLPYQSIRFYEFPQVSSINSSKEFKVEESGNP